MTLERVTIKPWKKTHPKAAEWRKKWCGDYRCKGTKSNMRNFLCGLH